MNEFPSYDSRRPLSYYRIGNVYSFYGKVGVTNQEATSEQIQKYGAFFDEDSNIFTNEENQTLKNTSATLDRFYGIVVDKQKPDQHGKNSKIIVLCCGIQNGSKKYFQKMYITNNSGCNMDGKNILSPSRSFSVNKLKNENIIEEKTGGITKTKKVGGITIAKKDEYEYKSENRMSETGIGGITKNQIGGITRAVGGITRKK